jgi:ribosomal-protein-alanine N-acetyltransferase
MKIFAETDSLLLREIVESDAKDLFELDSNPDVHRYLGNKPIKTLAEIEEIISYIRKQYHDNGIGRWAVVDKKTREFIGWSGLKHETKLRKDFHYYDLGYRLKPKFWGKGIATETAFLSLNYGFSEMKLSHIYACAHVENIGSNKVLKKVGFQFLEAFKYEDMLLNWYEFDSKNFTANSTSC